MIRTSRKVVRYKGKKKISCCLVFWRNLVVLANYVMSAGVEGLFNGASNRSLAHTSGLELTHTYGGSARSLENYAWIVCILVGLTLSTCVIVTRFSTCLSLATTLKDIACLPNSDRGFLVKLLDASLSARKILTVPTTKVS